MGHDMLRGRDDGSIHASRRCPAESIEPARLLDGIGGGLEEIEKLSRRGREDGVVRTSRRGRDKGCVRTSRRAFLGGGAATLGSVFLGSLSGLLTASGEALAGAVKTGLFIFPRLQFAVYDETPDIWNTGPIGDVNLKKKLQELTNINVSPGPKVVRLADFDDMARHPFVFMTSEGYFRLLRQEEKNLREFLERGGFVFADDCVYNAREDRFFRCYRDIVNRLFPDNPMRPIPLDHEIFHVYYDFDDGCPHMQGVRAGRSNAYALFERGTGRIMTFATPADLHCGWMRRYFGARKDMQAIKMGINIIIYFLSH